MNPYLLLALLGASVGGYGTLIGAGGGFLLVPVLLLLYPSARPETIAALSLTAVFFNASSGSIAYARMGRVDFKSGAMFGAACVPGALLGALTTHLFSTKMFDGLLGPLLVIVGITLLIRPLVTSEKSKDAEGGYRRRIVDRTGEVYEYSYNRPLGLAISAVVGFVSSLLGIGGGIIHVPALSRILNFPVHIATATSHFVLAIMALTGALVHLANGDLAHQGPTVCALVVGIIPGAQIGAALSNRIHGAWIIRALAIGLALVGIRVLILALHR